MPIFVKPNAGLPKLVDGETRFLVSSEEFAANVVRLVRAGARIVGGCCGTTPAHIAAVKAAVHTPDSETAQRLVKKLQDYITTNFYHCTDDILAGLGQMYICDERFKNNIDKNGEGTAEFVSEAIKILSK